VSHRHRDGLFALGFGGGRAIFENQRHATLAFERTAVDQHLDRGHTLARGRAHYIVHVDCRSLDPVALLWREYRHDRRQWQRRSRRSGRGGRLQRLVDVESAQYCADGRGPIEALAKAARREEIGRVIETPVDMPADQILAAGRGVVIPSRRPQYPTLTIPVHEQRQQLLAIFIPIPADRPVPQGRHSKPAVPAYVYRPRDIRNRHRPNYLPIAVEAAQPPICSHQERTPVQRDRHATRGLVRRQLESLAGELRRMSALPIRDRQARRVCSVEALRLGAEF